MLESQPHTSSPDYDRNKNAQNFWLPPYGYRHGVCMLVGLWTIAFYLQRVKGSFPLLTWPVNLEILIAWSMILVFIWSQLKNTPIFNWLTGIPMAICNLIGFLILALIAGIIPQDLGSPANLFIRHYGLNQIFSSWPFAITMLLLLSHLGLTVLKWLIPFRISRFVFILNHLGLWLALTCGLFGTGDIQRLNFILPEKSGSHLAYDRQGKSYSMPFAIYLKQFMLTEYPPTALLIDHKTGNSLWEKGDPQIELKPGVKGSFRQGLSLQVEKFYPHSRVGRNNRGLLTIVPSQNVLDAPASYVKVSSPFQRETIGWITRGGPNTLPQILSMGSYDLVMAEARPKSFTSQILLLQPHQSVQPVTLEVNQPFHVAGWQLYQHSYEQPIGSGQQISIIEAVSDPWIPGVYSGIYMMLLATLCMLMNVWRKQPELERRDNNDNCN